jgi:hypothetical protein
MVTAIIETTVMVDILRNYPPAVNWIQNQAQSALGITPIIWMEVVGGGPTKIKRIQAASLMKRFDIIDLTSGDQEWAMQQQMVYELSHGVA